MKFIPSSKTCVCVSVCEYFHKKKKKIYLHNEHTPIFYILVNVILKSFFIKIVNLQCFRCTEKWFSYIYIYLFQILFHYRLLQETECSSLCYIVGPCCYLQNHFLNAASHHLSWSQDPLKGHDPQLAEPCIRLTLCLCLKWIVRSRQRITVPLVMKETACSQSGASVGCLSFPISGIW